ncbi:alpha/beta hydrolase [uncultured Maricaulis sp.]|uniref:alpha/beta fold hydrolase n=1 Tax=uncultured Maricaulis sp. TaxID=174710 RepID=UPI0030D8AF07|tara:strand:+ start:12958 stop:14415 length:1458 start_codon:yes stop_codon:yes gene_type:complete
MTFILRLIATILGLAVLAIGGLIWWGWAPDIPHDELVAKYGQPPSQFVQLSSGVTVHMRDEGCADCPAVFLIHGSNASLQTWERWAGLLGEQWRVVSIDMPGHGLTGATNDGDYSIERAAGIVEEVRAFLGIEQFNLAGNSRGGAIALNYAVAHPERLISLALIDASGAPWPPADPDKETPFIYTLTANPQIARALKNFLPRPLVEQALRDAFSDQTVVTEPMIDRYYELIRHPGNRDATLERAQMAYSLDAFNQAASLTMPVLIMWGEDDHLVPISLAGEFAEAIPQAQTVTYPGVGHTPMEEIPEQSATDYQLFLEAAAAPTAAPATQTAASGQHQPGTALFGYYMPLQDPPVRAGDWVLETFYLGSDWEVDPWVADHQATEYPPAAFDFSDPTSEWVQGEIGGGYARRLRVWPGDLVVTSDSIAFDAVSDELGVVSFRGRYRRELILAAEASGSTDEAVLEGVLTIDGVVYENLRFGWFAGD